MSKSNAKKLVDKLSKDKKFRDALITEEAKVALKFAKKAGIECTPEELKEISGGWKFPKPGDLPSNQR
jgi:predicted ribosomally synthesized peptide with nif11-like leader